jgi:hypothetical protein
MASIVAQTVAALLGIPTVALGGYLISREDVRQRIVNGAWSILLWPELHKQATVYRPRHSLSRPIHPGLEHSTSILTQLV